MFTHFFQEEKSSNQLPCGSVIVHVKAAHLLNNMTIYQNWHMYKQKYPFKANHIHNKYQMFRLALIVKKMRFQFILYNLI